MLKDATKSPTNLKKNSPNRIISRRRQQHTTTLYCTVKYDVARSPVKMKKKTPTYLRSGVLLLWRKKEKTIDKTKGMTKPKERSATNAGAHSQGKNKQTKTNAK